METFAYIAILILVTSTGYLRVLGDSPLHQNKAVNTLRVSTREISFTNRDTEQPRLSGKQRHLLGIKWGSNPVFQELGGIYKVNRCVQEPRQVMQFCTGDKLQ